jgi:hypothetical protein
MSIVVPPGARVDLSQHAADAPFVRAPANSTARQSAAQIRVLARWRDEAPSHAARSRMMRVKAGLSRS